MPLGDSRTTTPSIAVLGTDAVIAALPATPVQLAHACLLAGYDHVVPASWGDELLAAECLRELETRGPVPAIQCSCPRVAARLLRLGADLSPLIISLVPPPVAVARYLRMHFGETRIRITYVGRCPAGSDPSFDAHFAPAELLDRLAESDIDPIDQPTAFDSVIPPDRRRFLSLPGGTPTADAVRALGDGRSLVELAALSADQLAQRLLGGDPVLVDLAPAAACDCAGADREGGRAALARHEPPRAHAAVLDAQPTLTLGLPLPLAAREVVDIVSTSPSPSLVQPPAAAPLAAAPRTSDDVRSRDEPISLGRRRLHPSPPAGMRPILGSAPTARSGEGRVLPRAYVARRRHPGEPRTDPAKLHPPHQAPAAPAALAPRAAVSPRAAPSPTDTAPSAQAHSPERVVARSPVPRADDTTRAPTTDSILATPPSASRALGAAPVSRPTPVAAPASVPASKVAAAERDATLVLGSRAFLGLLAGVVIVGVVLGLVGARMLARDVVPTATALQRDTATLVSSPPVTLAPPTTPLSAPVESIAPGLETSAPPVGEPDTVPAAAAATPPSPPTRERTVSRIERGTADIRLRPPRASRPTLPVATDSAARQAPARDTATSPLETERDRIRRELERRRARLDSLLRAREESTPR